MCTKTFAIAQQKGGVGKTTTTINIGAALAELDNRVLLIDLDPQGTLSIGFGMNPHRIDNTIYNALIDPDVDIQDVIQSQQSSLDLVPANIDLSGAEVELLNEIGRERILKDNLASVQSDYDFILLDCPPSLGLLTINALTAADHVLIPVQCHYYAMRGMQLLLRTIEKVKARSNPELEIFGMLPTFYDTRTTHSKEVLEELRRVYRELILDIHIKVRVSLADAGVGGESILEYDPKSDVAQAYRDLAKEVIKHG